MSNAFAFDETLENRRSPGGDPSADSLAQIEQRMDQSALEIEELTAALSIKFEELSLIYQLTETLRLDQDAQSSCWPLVKQLNSCINADWILIELDEDDDSEFPHTVVVHENATKDTKTLSGTEHPYRVFLQEARQRLDAGVPAPPPTIRNHPQPECNQSYRLVAVSLERAGNRLGRLVAIRNLDKPEFGTVEADLMQSTGMLLGVHLVNQRQFHQMQQMFESMVTSLVSALDAKDAYTCGHSSRVADLSVELARRVGYGEDDLKRIHQAGLLHDIGKIGVEDAVLRKPGRLTKEEFEQIKLHPVLGYEILKGVRPFRGILPAVRHHHEAMDGSGYPDGLVGDEIPRDAQVMAVADAFDAMTSDRPYRKGMPLEKVVDIFERGHGKQWAGDVVDVLLSDPEMMLRFSLREPSEDVDRDADSSSA